MLATELDELVSHLAELGRTALPLLPGLSADRVEAGLGYSVPSDVAEWFAWCNGVEVRPGQIQDDVNLIPGYSPVFLDDAVRMRGDYAGDLELGEHWIPLLAGAGGDIYAAVWKPGASSSVAGVLVGEPTEIEFESIEQMISVFNACFRRHAFMVNIEGRLEMDPELYGEIYEEITG